MSILNPKEYIFKPPIEENVRTITYIIPYCDFVNGPEFEPCFLAFCASMLISRYPVHVSEPDQNFSII